jgi:hypothetical protein
VLATLAIIVWHFYHVIFDPDVYPLNFALVDGRISEQLYKEEHELAYDEMKQTQSSVNEAPEENESSIADTPPARAGESNRQSWLTKNLFKDS